MGSTAPAATSRSTRVRNPPPYLQDYHCSAAITKSNSLYPMKKYLSFDKFCPSYKAFLVSVILIEEQKHFLKPINVQNGALQWPKKLWP